MWSCTVANGVSALKGTRPVSISYSSDSRFGKIEKRRFRSGKKRGV